MNSSLGKFSFTKSLTPKDFSVVLDGNDVKVTLKKSGVTVCMSKDEHAMFVRANLLPPMDTEKK